VDEQKVQGLGPPDNVERMKDHGCPECGSKWLFLITSPVACAQLTTLAGNSTYAGCPACGWRSKALTVATGNPATRAQAVLELKDNVHQRLQVLEGYRKELEDLIKTIEKLEKS
jgi:predicted  nucleic acid-binding Zn-ribbon protein